MDLVTQAILGAAVAEAGGWRAEFGKSAIFAGLFFGMAPDFDIIARLGGEWSSLIHHRGITHSVFFAPVVAPVCGWLIWKARGSVEGHWRRWSALIFWALLTHPLLDLFTSYGTQLLTPLSQERFALDGVSIIDPIYTVPLLTGLILCAVWRKNRVRGQRLMAALLIATTAYLGFGAWQSMQVSERASVQLARSVSVVRTRAMPTIGNMVLWRVVAKDGEGTIHVGMHSQFAPKPAIVFHQAKALDSPLVQKALADPRGKIYRWFADDLLAYTIEEPGQGGMILQMADMRYGGVRDPLEPMWGARAMFDDQMNVVEITRFNTRRTDGESLKAELRALWRAIWSGP